MVTKIKGMPKHISSLLACLINVSNDTDLFVKNALFKNSYFDILETSWKDLEKNNQRYTQGYLAIGSLFKL